MEKLGIDFQAMLLYLVNFGVILWLLTRFVYKPLIKFLDERRNTVHKNLSQAEDLRLKFEKELSERETEYGKLLENARTEALKSKAEAQNSAKYLLIEAEAEKERLLKEAKKQAEGLKRQIESELEEDIISRVTRIVYSAVRDNRSPEAAAASVRTAWKELKKN